MIVDIWRWHVTTLAFTREQQYLAVSNSQKHSDSARTLVSMIGAATNKLLLDDQIIHG